MTNLGISQNLLKISGVEFLKRIESLREDPLVRHVAHLRRVEVASNLWVISVSVS